MLGLHIILQCSYLIIFRLVKEQQDKLELFRGMDKDAEDWETAKHRERELKEMKRGRDLDPGEDEVMKNQGGVKKRKKIKVKKLQYARVGENWGEDDQTDQDQDKVVFPPPPVVRRSGDDNTVLERKRGL